MRKITKNRAVTQNKGIVFGTPCEWHLFSMQASKINNNYFFVNSASIT